MTKINISKRLLLIANMVDKDSNIIDIGCDHALLDIYLMQNKIIKSSIASDVTIGALNQAKKNISLSNVNIETRLGDGLKVLNSDDEVDTIIMSGLGMSKIRSILYDDKDKLDNINTIIIQSNNGLKDIRKSVTKLGYYIKDENIVKERNKYYCVIKFSKGKIKYSNKEYKMGPVLLKNKPDIFYDFINNKINKNIFIISHLPKSKFIKKIILTLENKRLKKEVQ